MGYINGRFVLCCGRLSGLKVGQVFEAAIPIAIIAVGASTAARRKNALGENVIIQSIGACSGAVVAGAIFTLPAIYILQAKYPEMTTSFFNIFMASAWAESSVFCSLFRSENTLSATCMASIRSLKRLQQRRY